MAIELLDEHEQSELVRNWLRSNFSAMAFGLIGGFVMIWLVTEYLPQWQQSKRDQAGREYASYLEVVAKKDPAAIHAAGEKLRTQFASSPYAVLSALNESSATLDAGGDSKSALAPLQWAKTEAELPELRDLAALRLARVQLEVGETDAALTTLDAVDAVGFASQAAEIRGDVLLAQGKASAARAAYELALIDLDASSSRRQLVEMKRDDLPVTSATAKAGG